MLAAISPLHYIAPTYAAPASLPSTPSSMQRQAHLRYGDDELELLGYAIDRQTALPGDTIEITLYVEALQRMTTDYSMFIHLWGADMEWLGARDSFLGRGAWPTSQMSAGQIIEDRYVVSIAPTATVPSRIRMEIGFYEFESGRRLWATSPDGTRSELPFVGRIKLASPRPGDRTPLPSILSFEDKLSLVSATAQTPPAIQAGSTITVSTTWQAKNTMAEDYTIFMQVVDAGLTIVAQRDIQPQRRRLPDQLLGSGRGCDRSAHARAARDAAGRALPHCHRHLSALDRRAPTRQQRRRPCRRELGGDLRVQHTVKGFTTEKG